MATPPVLVLLDLSALLDGNTQKWQDYSRLGSCYLPQAIYQELEFLSGRSPEPEWEKIAREVLRFFPNSGWQLTDVTASHPALNAPSGQAASKEARLRLAVAQCAYGLSQEHPGELVVLASNTKQVLQNLAALQSPNLCGITGAALLQWARTGQQPPAVTQQMQALLKTRGRVDTKAASPKPLANQPAKPATKIATPMAGPATAARSPASTSRRSNGLSGLVGIILAVIGVAIASAFAWRTIQPASFNQVWQQLGLPSQQPAQKPNPGKK
jgi:hypothetical protein